MSPPCAHAFLCARRGDLLAAVERWRLWNLARNGGWPAELCRAHRGGSLPRDDGLQVSRDRREMELRQRSLRRIVDVHERRRIRLPVQALHAATAAWRVGALTNLEYLLKLNELAGRRRGDPNKHPFVPWVIDFTVDPDDDGDDGGVGDGGIIDDSPASSSSTTTSSTTTTTTSAAAAAGWRDLTRSKWRINKGDEQLLASYSIGEQMLAQWRTITTTDDAVPPPEACPHHVPDAPLSELAYHIYFARHLPLASLTRAVRTRFEAREYPKTLVRLYSWTPDECVPELYEDEHFFESRHREFADMAVPDWCLGKDENVQQARRRFIEKHRRALEGRRASSELHRWIDLVFGAALFGDDAVSAMNVPLVPSDAATARSHVAHAFGKGCVPGDASNGWMRGEFTRASADVCPMSERIFRQAHGICAIFRSAHPKRLSHGGVVPRLLSDVGGNDDDDDDDDDDDSDDDITIATSTPTPKMVPPSIVLPNQQRREKRRSSAMTLITLARDEDVRALGVIVVSIALMQPALAPSKIPTGCEASAAAARQQLPAITDPLLRKVATRLLTVPSGGGGVAVASAAAMLRSHDPELAMAHTLLLYVFAPTEAEAGGPPLLRAAMLCGGTAACNAPPVPDHLARIAAAMGLRSRGAAASAACAASSRRAATLAAPSLLALAAAAMPTSEQGAGRYGSATSASAAGAVVAGILGSACARRVAVASGLALLAAVARGGDAASAMLQGGGREAASPAAAAAFAESVLGPSALDASRVKCGIEAHARLVSAACVQSIAAIQRALDAHTVSMERVSLAMGVGCGADVAEAEEDDDAQSASISSLAEDTRIEQAGDGGGADVGAVDGAALVAGLRRLASAYAAAIARDSSSLPLSLAIRYVVDPLLAALDESAAEGEVDVGATHASDAMAAAPARELARALASAASAACPPLWLADYVLPRLMRRVDAGANALNSVLEAASGGGGDRPDDMRVEACAARAASVAVDVLADLTSVIPPETLVDVVVAPRAAVDGSRRHGSVSSPFEAGAQPTPPTPSASENLAGDGAATSAAADIEATQALAGGGPLVRLALLASPLNIMRTHAALRGVLAQVDRGAVVDVLIGSAERAGGATVTHFLLPQLLQILREPLLDDADADVDNEKGSGGVVSPGRDRVAAGAARAIRMRMMNANLRACASLLRCMSTHAPSSVLSSGIDSARLRALAVTLRGSGQVEASEIASHMATELLNSSDAGTETPPSGRLSRASSLGKSSSITSPPGIRSLLASAATAVASVDAVRRGSLDSATSTQGGTQLRTAVEAQRDAERWRHAERAVALLSSTGWGEPAADSPMLTQQQPDSPPSDTAAAALSDSPFTVNSDMEQQQQQQQPTVACRWGWVPVTSRSFADRWHFSGEVVHTWRAHRRPIRCATVDSAEEVLLTGGRGDDDSGGGIVRIWDVSSGGRVVSPGNQAASVSSGEYRRHSDPVIAVAALTRRRAISVDRGGDCHVWLIAMHGGCPTLCELSAPPPTSTAPPSSSSKASSSSGFTSVETCGEECEQAIAGTADGRVVRIDLERGCAGAAWSPGPFDGGGTEPGGAVTSLTCDARGELILAGYAGGGMAAFDCRSGGRAVAFVNAHEGGVSSVLVQRSDAEVSTRMVPTRYAPPRLADTSRLASHVLLSGGADRAVKLWDVRTWKPMRSVRVHKDPVGGLVRLSGGNFLSWAGPRWARDSAMSGVEGSPKPVKLRVRARGGAKDSSGYSCIGVARASRVLFVGGDDGSVRVAL